MEKQTVWMLYIHHRHGHDMSAHRSREGAVKALARYCRENWSDVPNGEAVPEGDVEVVAQYFKSWEEYVDLERYELESMEVQE